VLQYHLYVLAGFAHQVLTSVSIVVIEKLMMKWLLMSTIHYKLRGVCTYPLWTLYRLYLLNHLGLIVWVEQQHVVYNE